jgi:uncharacterized membrane protein
LISSVTFHPFFSHFPLPLFIAGILLLRLSQKKDNPRMVSAANFNFSMGLLILALAALSGMISADLDLRATIEIEAHQGYSLLAAIFYAFSAGYSYVKAFSRAAFVFYGLTLLSLIASIYSGYLLTFYS